MGADIELMGVGELLDQGYIDCERKGYASVKDIENLGYLYPPYHALGGNGTGTELFERVKHMPAKPEKEEFI